jgi:uncharacterized protein YjlB
MFQAGKLLLSELFGAIFQRAPDELRQAKRRVDYGELSRFDTLQSTADICRTAATPEVLERMKRVRFPASDPLTGRTGALPKLWIVT